MKTPLLFAVLLSLTGAALARPVSSVKQVRTVYDAGWRGDRYFNTHFRGEMRGMGIRFVNSRKNADAILRSNGDGTRAGGFSGSASLTTPAGRLLWSARVERAPRSRSMAFNSLAQRLRVARR